MPVTIVLSDSAAAELRGQLCGSTPPGPTAAPGPTVTPPVPPIAGTVYFELPWANTTGATRLIVPFTCEEAVCIHFRTPSSTLTNAGMVSMAEFGAAPYQRFGVLSTTPGDFSGTMGPPYYNVQSGVSLSWNIQVGGAPQDWITPLAPDTDYYINVRNTDAHGNKSCAVGANTSMFCDLRLPT